MCVYLYIYTHFVYIYIYVCVSIYIYLYTLCLYVYIYNIYIHIYRRLSLRVSRICLCRPQCRDALHFARGTPMFMYIYIHIHTHLSLSLSSTYYMSIAFPNELMSQDKHTGSPSIQLTGEMGPSYTLYGEKNIQRRLANKCQS